MTHPRSVYEQAVLDHSKAPRNYREAPEAQYVHEGYNPLCGDRFMVYLDMEEGRVTDAAFSGSGCAISKSSASVMTEAIRGRTVGEIETLVEAFKGMLEGAPEDPVDKDALGDLAMFSPLRAYPVRMKCATLPWQAALAALREEKGPATTE